MNRINFLGKPDFPNSSQTMNMLQGIATLGCMTAAKLGGKNYILSGCIDRGGIVSGGIIVIEGIPYVFEGGNKKDKVSIKEVNETLMAFGVEYPEARTICTVVFSDKGEYPWSDFSQILTNRELEKRIEAIQVKPYGMPEMFVGYLDKIPPNYRLCNGDYLSQDEFPELHKVIGTLHGSNAPGNFALPDMRKMFVVGYDNAHTDYNAIGKTGGKDRVELSESEMPKHYHKYSDDTNALGRFPSVEPGFPQSVGDVNETKSSGSSSGTGTVYKTSHTGGTDNTRVVAHENRPPFFTVAYIIRVTD